MLLVYSVGGDQQSKPNESVGKHTSGCALECNVNCALRHYRLYHHDVIRFIVSLSKHTQYTHTQTHSHGRLTMSSRCLMPAVPAHARRCVWEFFLITAPAVLVHNILHSQLFVCVYLAELNGAHACMCACVCLPSLAGLVLAVECLGA